MLLRACLADGSYVLSLGWLKVGGSRAVGLDNP